MRTTFLILATPLALHACSAESSPGSSDPFAESETVIFVCGEGQLEARFIEENARLVIDSATYDLVRVEADTGMRYTAPNEPELSFWNRGEAATLSLPGDPDLECRLDL